MKTLLFLITSITFASCQPEAEKSFATLPESAPEAPAEPAIDVSKTDTLIGKSLAKVQAACDAAKVRHRVVMIDGKPQIATRDYLPDRLNFSVEKGVITKVTKG